METDNINVKLIGAAAVGAIGGLLLGSYLWGNRRENNDLSKHLSTLSKVLKEIEGIDTAEAKDLKYRIHNILNTIDSSDV
jgi:hypothetical protein